MATNSLSGKASGLEKQIVVFRLSDEEFGVNISEVREIIRYEHVTSVPDTEDYVKGIIKLRDSILVIIDLATKLGLPRKEPDNSTRIIVIEIEDSKVGMIVDAASEVLRLMGDQIRPSPKELKTKVDSAFIEGECVVGERLLVMLDLRKVIHEDDRGHISKVEKRGITITIEPKPEVKPADAAAASLKKAEGIGLLVEKSLVPEGNTLPSTEKGAMLNDVSDSEAFRGHDGRLIKNLHELVLYISTIEESTLANYANGEKNDFSNWIRHCLHDSVLADRIRPITKKAELTQCIMARILEKKQ